MSTRVLIDARNGNQPNLRYRMEGQTTRGGAAGNRFQRSGNTYRRMRTVSNRVVGIERIRKRVVSVNSNASPTHPAGVLT